MIKRIKTRAAEGASYLADAKIPIGESIAVILFPLFMVLAVLS